MLTTWVAPLNHGWRVFATGLSFVVFGLGGISIALLLTLLLYLVPIARPRKLLMARKTITQSFRLYIWMMKRLGLLTFHVSGLENIPTEGCLVVANHPSLLDVVFLISQISGSNCVVKASLKRNVFTRGPILVSGYVANDSDDFISGGERSIRSGSPLIVFPEGTRTTPGESHEFQRGAANIALAARCGIVPVIISCEPATLLKGQPWYRIPPRPAHFEINFQPVLNLDNIIDSEAPKSKSARVLTRYLQRYFTERVVPASTSQ